MHYQTSFAANRWIAAVICLAMVALCFGYHFSRPSLPPWWRDSGGGIPYVMFWVTVGFLIVPNPRFLGAIAIGCTLMTCGLECLQLWQPPWLTEFRSTAFGAALLGNQFVWQDIPPYFLGGLAGWSMIKAVLKITPPREPK